jgi:hypothetical protein
MIDVEFDSVVRWRNTREYRRVPRATYGEYEEVGDHSLMKSLCKRLIADGYDPDLEVRVWRGKTPVFTPVKLRIWAEGRFGKKEQPKHLQRGSK